MDYIITFIYGDERYKTRVNNSPSEKDAVRTATVRARINGYPYLPNAQIKVNAAASQKKNNKP